jgi:hypothetical protein
VYHSVLKKHSTVVEVMEMANKALSNLAQITGNSSWLGPAGACDAIIVVTQVSDGDRETSLFLHLHYYSALDSHRQSEPYFMLLGCTEQPLQY